MAATIVVAGVHASFQRGVMGRFTAYYSFDYWDVDVSVERFFVQYLAIVGMYTFLAYCLLPLFKRRDGTRGQWGFDALSAISGCDKGKCATGA